MNGFKVKALMGIIVLLASFGNLHSQERGQDSAAAKPVKITQTLSDAEISSFKKLATADNPLGRVTKYSYHKNGLIRAETAYNFVLGGTPELNWEDNYFYSADSLIKITRYRGYDQPEEISLDSSESKKVKTYNAKKQLIKTFIQLDHDYTYEERFVYDEQGRVAEKTTLTFGEVDGVGKFVYNDKNLVVKELRYKGDQLNYTYAYTYDNLDRVIRFDMIDESGVLTGAWLYLYNAQGKLAYQIDLYGKLEEKKPTFTESPPPPPPLKNNQ